MLEIATRRVCIRHLALAVFFAMPLLAGCAGVHLHNANDEKLAKEAQTAFKDAGLLKALDSERLLVAEQNQRHRAALRAHAEAMRDVSLAQIIGSSDPELSPLENAVEARIKKLTNGRSIEIDELHDKILRSREALERAELNFNIVQGKLRDKSTKNVLRLSCPLDKNVDCEKKPTCNSVAFNDYKAQCVKLTEASKNLKSFINASVKSKDPGELEKVWKELEELKNARDGAVEKVKTAMMDYKTARQTYQEALTGKCNTKSQTTASVTPDEKVSGASSSGEHVKGKNPDSENCLANVADDLANKLKKLGMPSEKVTEAMGQDARGKIEEVGEQLRSLSCVLAVIGTTDDKKADGTSTSAAAADGKSSCPKAGTAAYGTELRVASTLSIVNEALTKTKQPIVSALLIEAERLRLKRELLQSQVDQEDKRITIMETRARFLTKEVDHLLEARASISTYKEHKCDSQLSVYNAVRSNKSPRCAEIAAQALISYASAWNAGRIPAKEAEASLIALRHEAVLDASENAFALWNQALGIPIGRVLAYHESGISSEDLANLIHALGLGAIAVRVK